MVDKNKIDFLRLAQELNMFPNEKNRHICIAAASDILPTPTVPTKTSHRRGDNRSDSIEITIDNDHSLKNGENEDEMEEEDLENERLDDRINEAIV